MPRGAKPKAPGEAKHRNPVVHPWTPAPGRGWQHGDPTDKRRKIPKPPVGLLPESEVAWEAWFKSWWASFWALEDLPALTLVIHTFDAVRRGAKDETKLLPLLDRWGISPKGRQDLRWAAPPAEVEPEPKAKTDDLAKRREARRSRVS